MSIPISGLDVATVINDDDLILVRQGLVDKQAQAILMRTIDIDALDELTSPAPTDKMVISNGVQNFKISYSKVSFPSGTIMWFYQADAPAGWEPFDNTSGALLSVSGPSGATYTGPGTIKGSWQQSDHTLTINQMPTHRHGVAGTSASTGSGNIVRGYRNSGSDFTDFFTKNEGGGQPHNHGNTWRPLAHVGILCKKL